jgi:HK97 family phage major capsid protein
LNCDALVEVAKETGQAASTIVKENLDKMYSRMLPSSLGSAIWIAHPDTFPQLASLSQAVGTGGGPVWVANMSGGAPNSIYGRPLIFSEKAQTLGTKGDIYFVDLSYYLIGDRQALTTSASAHVNFTTMETVFLFTERLDGRCWLDSALTPRNGSNTVSPIVALASRS